ncbi:MAG TPA: c-type cytochrome, partial [Gammaproteobacteria bacterium]
MNRARTLQLLLLLLATPLAAPAVAAGAVAQQFQQYCASCHGADRLGGMGPALLPENLSRLRREAAHTVIREGRAATQMPAFGESLSAAEIEALTDYIYTPLAQLPEWGLEAIRASRISHVGDAALATKPRYDADPLNLFLVVELGDHHATVLDGDSFTPLDRFP